jgi:hypothetical protein
MASMNFQGPGRYFKEQGQRKQDQRKPTEVLYGTVWAEASGKYIQRHAQNIRRRKRNYQHNPAANAARRRRESIWAGQPRKLDDERAIFLTIQERKNDELREIIIEHIYADLQHHYLHPKEISMESYDPYPSIMAQRVTRQRFEDAMQTLGLEFLSILMTSKMFCNSMQRFGITISGDIAVVGDQEYAHFGTWDTLLEKLLSERSSIRAFAFSRRVHYVDVYRRSAQAELGMPLQEPHDFPHGLRNPHEVYHAADGRLCPNLFWPNSQNATPQTMKNISRNIYNPKNFQGYPRPDGWASTWTYPAQDIQHPCSKWGQNYPPCVSCGKRTGPPTRSIGAMPSTNCSCSTAAMFSEILVEIKEYDSYVPGSLNRGVRALQSFPRGCILGEYLGEFIPLNTHKERGDEIYAMEFGGPSYLGRSSAFNSDPISPDTSGDVFPIATLIAGANGSWTRFINAPSEGELPNCAFRHEALAGKLTVTLRAIQNIRFGEQLLVDYGEGYWSGAGEL